MEHYITFATYLTQQGLTRKQAVSTARAYDAWWTMDFQKAEKGKSYEEARVNYLSLRDRMERIGVTGCEMFDYHDDYKNRERE